MALQDAEPAPWDSLPRDALVRVLRQLDSHVPSLCAAACVARAWRDAAAEPSLWARPQGLWWRAAERLTEERLEALVARARGGLERLDLRGARFIEDDGREAALQASPTRWTRSSSSSQTRKANRTDALRWVSHARWRRAAAACACWTSKAWTVRRNLTTCGPRPRKS